MLIRVDSSPATWTHCWFKKIGIAVVMCNSDGQKLLPILLSNKNTRVDTLVVHSWYVNEIEIDRAIDILESSLRKQEPSEDILSNMQDSVTEFQLKHSLYLIVSVDQIVIQGYAEDDVAAV